MRRISQVLQSTILSCFFCASGFSNVNKASDLLIGSGMTDAEEAQVISKDVTVSKLIRQASADYGLILKQYQSGSLPWDQLQIAHDKIFIDLTSAVKEQIESSQGEIHVIASDYDEDHEVAFDQHVQLLLGLAQQNLGILASQVFMPPLPAKDLTYPNLIEGGDIPSSDNWELTAGSGTLVNGQIITQNPNGASFSQTITTVPGNWYLISGNINGANEGKDKYGNENVYSGTISAIHANKDFIEASDELDEGSLHRRYFWVQANDTSMTISLTGAGAINTDEGPFFQNISVRDLDIDCSTEAGQEQAMALAQIIIPPVLTTGSQEVGWYSQIENNLAMGDNLIDGSISIMKNIDMSALGNAGHPYWYFGKENENPVDKDIKIINGVNDIHGLFLPALADATTNGPVPIPRADYTVICDVYVPEDGEGSVRISFCGTNLNDGSQIEKFYQDYSSLPVGMNTITLQVLASLFPESGVFFRPAITFENTGTSSLNIYNIKLAPNTNEVYAKINSINPYNPDRSWYDLKGCNQIYDFTSGDINFDWGIALTGNTMFSANVKDVTLMDSGILLSSHSVDPNHYDGGGVQSTQMIDPMRDFSVAVTFIAKSNDPGYEPTVAVWTYGESQRGPDAPLSHRNGSGSDPITEFDCEMGSDPGKGQAPADPDKMYMRPGSYIGYEAGGHSEVLSEDTLWPLMPNFWQKNATGAYDHYNLTMSGNWVNGHLLLTRSIEDADTKVTTELGTQDLGQGPFSPMYIKIALENPDWNAKSHTVGQASLVIQQILVIQGADIPENISHKIPFSDMDYMWFTPGGGGGLSYTPFCPRNLYKKLN